MFTKLRPLDWSSPGRGLAAGAATAAVVVGVSLARQRARAGAARRAVEVRRVDAASARAALAASLADSSRHTLLTFQSRDCTLCDALKAPLQEVGRRGGLWSLAPHGGTVEHERLFMLTLHPPTLTLHPPTHTRNQVADQEDGWLDIVTIDADNGEAWALEVSGKRGGVVFWKKNGASFHLLTTHHTPFPRPCTTASLASPPSSCWTTGAPPARAWGAPPMRTQRWPRWPTWCPWRGPSG